MRSRQTAGILKHIGVTDMITSNQREYINIAVKLGLNLYLRQQIVNKIQKKQSIIYENVNCIQALENFYRKQFSMNPS
jgi:predicted O-linked N-acetylglucosamine transferase (SPINDLY family)